MLFNSFRFLVFFLVVYTAYLSLRHKGQNRMLLAASLFFYGTWNWKFLGILVFSIVIDYTMARAIARTASASTRKLLFTVSICNGLGLLGFFKYYNFFVDNVTTALSWCGFNVAPLHLNLILPIGISFYTFHTLSYVWDVYARKVPACQSLVDFALFVTFFPQLVAGPIARADQLLPQVQHPRTIQPKEVLNGLFLIGWGLFTKVIVADGCAHIVNAVFRHDDLYRGIDKLVAVYAFAFQILGDFSGYSDMARGLAKLMGFELMLNFNLPYFATGPSDFWSRWHISLSTWLRDYLYIPLGGNRGGPLTTYRNLLLTMVIGGIWHGASWTMFFWGAYHGLVLIGHRLIGPRLSFPTRPWTRIASIFLMFHVTCLGWLLFRAESAGQVLRFLRGIGGDFHASAFTSSYVALFAQLVAPLLAIQSWQYFAGTLDVFAIVTPVKRTLLVTAIMSCVIVFLVFHRSLVQAAVPFIYFQF